jgi:hypothetical protein
MFETATNEAPTSERPAMAPRNAVSVEVTVLTVSAISCRP